MVINTWTEVQGRLIDSFYKQDPCLLSSSSAGSLGGHPWNPTTIPCSSNNLLHKPMSCFSLSSCLTSQCSRRRFISIWSSSYLTSCWEKSLHNHILLSFPYEGFPIWNWFAFQNTDLKNCWFLSVAFLAQLGIKLQNANVFCRLQCFWLRSTETCFQSATIIMMV